MQIVVLVMWGQETDLRLPLLEGASPSTTPKDSGSLTTGVHCNIYTQVTPRQVWQAGQLPGGDREGGEITPVISSEWTSVLPGSLAFSLGARQVLAQLGPYRGISCDKGEPLSHMHTVAFGQSNVVMLFWNAEKCCFFLCSVEEDTLSQQSSDCFSTSPSP